jgi:orotate phosphoribosyltransferase
MVMNDSSKLSALADLVKRLAVVRGRVILASGREADYYVDMRAVTLAGQAAPLVGQVMLDLVADWRFDAVGGLTMGADPVALAMVHAQAARRESGELPVGTAALDAFVVRKEAKTHGLNKRIEGPLVANRRVLVVEDTSTTGGSPLTAVDALRDAGATVVGVAVVVDRDAGAREAVENAGLPYRTALGLADLGLA